VLGCGYRGTVESLDALAQERVHAATVAEPHADDVHAVETNVLYAVARRDGERGSRTP
jgi:hypothetical protein